MSATTNSLRLTKISFGTGASKEKLEGDETITFTYNKTLDQDLLKGINDVNTVDVASGSDSYQTIKTELGTFVTPNSKTLFKTTGDDISAEYKVSGNTIVITLKGLSDSKYEKEQSVAWENLAISYDGSVTSLKSDSTSLDLSKVRALDGTYAAVGDDKAVSKASNLASGDMVSYADVDAALAKYNAAITNIKVDGDFDAAEAAGAEAEKAVAKVPDTATYYKGESGLLKTYNDAFKPYKEVHDVYKTLDADKLQSILNERTIKLPATANDSALGLATNSATIGYVCTASTAGGIGVVSANDAFVRPIASGTYNTVSVVVTITSSTGNKTLTMEFKVKVPYSGTIEVSKVGDATFGSSI